MGAGTIRWSGSFTLPASGPGSVSSVAESITTMASTDIVVATISNTSSQSEWSDVNRAFQVQIVKSTSGFTAYADRAQLPGDTIFDYIVLTVSS